MYIAYDIKNGVKYAKLYTSHRKGQETSKEYINLGRVLDEERGIYKNRERGVFTFDLDSNTYGEAPVDFVPELITKSHTELLLDFGDAFFLDSYMRNYGFMDVIDAIEYGNPDTLKAMICYYILCSTANCHAGTWWEGSYASILYPKANLTSQRISDFLATIGDEEHQRRLFKAYFPFLKTCGYNLSSILIDSTGLPNSIHFSLTAINNHAGEISNEVRLIYVIQQETGMPIYFRYCHGNVIDANTVPRCIKELEAQGVSTKFAIIDAGYFTHENVDILFENDIAFITRLQENRKLYKEIVNDNINTLESKENMIRYNGKFAYLKRIACDVYGHPGFAYLGLDISNRADSTEKIFRRATADNISVEDVFNELKMKGVFILISSRDLELKDVLPLYYTRTQIEQIFDIGKNYANFLPLNVQTEVTFRGHLVLTFIATAIVKQIQKTLQPTSENPISMFMALRNQKCKVYDKVVIPQEQVKRANDCYKLFKIECSTSITRQAT
ncbi:MAG: transposase [Clostridia bacterium]|nr:transposase [Clostridia bacterium]